jgi:hypothetical protein
MSVEKLENTFERLFVDNIPIFSLSFISRRLGLNNIAEKAATAPLQQQQQQLSKKASTSKDSEKRKGDRESTEKK